MATVIAPAVAFGDRTVTARYFGTGDASRLVWNLAGMDSDRALLMPVIYRKDWQMPGHYRLYSTARTNLSTGSQIISDLTEWPTLARVTTSADAAVAPDGTTTADAVLETAVTNSHYIQHKQINISNTTVYTLSGYVKKLGRRYFTAHGDASGGFLGGLVSYDLDTGTVQANGAGITSSSITSVGDGWYRFVLTATSTGVTAFPGFQGKDTTGASYASFAGDITKGFYLWGVQVETGSSATPYIPTTTVAASVTDYAVDANGKVTFAAAPVLSADVAYLDPWFGTAIYKSFGTGDGTATQFSLPWKSVTPAIYIDGVLQTLTTNYTVTPGGAVTFVVAPGNGAVLTWTGSMGAQR